MIFIQVNIHIFLWFVWNDSLQTIFVWLQSFTFIIFYVYLNSGLTISILTLPHISVCIFFHCNFPLFSSVGIHRLFLEFIKKGVCCLGRKLHLHAWERPKGFCGVWQGSYFFISFWEGGVRKRVYKKGFLERRKVKSCWSDFFCPHFFLPYYIHLIFFSFFCMYKPLN